METHSKLGFESKLLNFENNVEIGNKVTLHDTKINSKCCDTNKNTSPTLPNFVPTDGSLYHEPINHDLSNEKTERSLSSQVMKYYYEYSQNSNLNKYFSLPGSQVDKYEYRWRLQNEDIPKFSKNYKSSNENKSMCEEALKDRRKLTRPPLIGQPSGPTADAGTCYEQIAFNVSTSTDDPCIDVNSNDKITKRSNIDDEKILENDSAVAESVDRDVKTVSPTSSVASHKPLEWDSWADVGYFNTLPVTKECPPSVLQTIEKVALIDLSDLDSTSLRLDPEGTTSTNIDSFRRHTKVDTLSKSPPYQFTKPNANSTRFTDDISSLATSGDVKITPIARSNLPGIITGTVFEEETQSFVMADNRRPDKLSSREKNSRFVPINASNAKQDNPAPNTVKTNCGAPNDNKQNTLKRNVSMNELAMPLVVNPLKRSQSELNLRGPLNRNRKDSLVPFNFVSTSSITTIINKRVTCDKNIQTNWSQESIQKRESKAIQAGDINNVHKNAGDVKNIQTNQINENKRFEELSKGSSTSEAVQNTKQKTLQPILKNTDENAKTRGVSKRNIYEGNSSFPSGSQEEADGGRASNSFEYFPGHIYQNVPQGESTSHASTINTDRSHSTMPNTSSSLDEKLWGDSDNLLRDLERSLSVLKSLVNTNKCDKQIKKRLIHHVIKRLVTARYTDDRIERNLEENVPWNPDNARNKIYCTEIIQALANKQSHHDSTEESVENWKLNQQAYMYNKKLANRDRKFSDMIQFASSEESDGFEERTTDRTDGMQDGRKARLGLRSDDKYHHSRHHHKYQMTERTLDTDKSESSECFLPHSQGIKHKGKITNKLPNSEMSRKVPLTPSTPLRKGTHPIIAVAGTSNAIASAIATSTPATNSTTVAAITSTDTTAFTSTSASSTSKIQSLDEHKELDWRLPTTISERRFKYEKSTKLGTMTRLIDYVEMEKKNQLVWINNEINHLSNLKKLLEEPSGTVKQVVEIDFHPRVTSSDKKNTFQHGNNASDKILRDQWSSHGNIAEMTDKKDLERKKKNCYTQTTMNGSAPLRTNDAGISKVSNNDVRTSRSQTINSKSESSASQSKVSSTEESKSSEYPFQCHCPNSRSHSTETCCDYPAKIEHNVDKRPIITQPLVTSKKETKNRLNDRCKEFTTIEQPRESYFGVKNHCRGCLCESVSDHNLASSKTDHDNNQNNSSTSESSCNCTIPRDSTCDQTKHKRSEASRLRMKSETNEKMKQNEEQRGVLPAISHCKTCGIAYPNAKNRKCQCVPIHYAKPIAYELSFNPKNNQKTIKSVKPVNVQTQSLPRPSSLKSMNSCKIDICQCNASEPQLQDYLKKNRPEFVNNAETRQRYMGEISQLRQLKREKLKQLLALGLSSPKIKSKTLKRSAKPRRKISDEEMRNRLRLKYLRLNEVRSKRRQQEKSEQLKRNHLMAKIFCKKLQQKVLEGRVNLSQSASVISNF